MARIAGIDLPKNKRGVIGLTYIYGIGSSVAKNILDKAGIYLKVNPKSEDEAEDNILLDEVLAEEIEKSRGKPLTLNVTGALGAVLNDVSFPVEVMRGVAAVSRAAGLIGHVYEEMENPIAPSVVEFINNIEYRDPD